MYIESKQRLIEDNDLVKVKIDIVSDDESFVTWFEVTFTHGYLHELNEAIPTVIFNNLNNIEDRYAIICINLDETEKKELKEKYSVVMTENDVIQVTVDKVYCFEEKWNLSEREKVEIAKLLKERGNYRAKKCDWKSAFRNYWKASKYLKGSVSVLDSTHDCHYEARAVLVDSMNNLSMSCLKLNSGYGLCVKYCNFVLDLDPMNVKALFRKGKAYYEKKNYERALESFCKGLDLDLESDVRENFEKFKIRTEEFLSVQKESDKTFYKDMFDNLEKQALLNLDDDENGLSAIIREGKVDYWDNSMANEIMSINEELEAFGEEMLLKPNVSNKKKSSDSRRVTIEEVDEDEYE